MLDKREILYEDNHLIAVNKHAGMPVQTDHSGDMSLEEAVKMFIKERDGKPGAVFLGVIHRIDRPVSGVVLFAKSSKALVRMNEMVRDRRIDKRYLAIVSDRPAREEGELVHYIERNSSKNRSYAHTSPRGDSKEARLRYRVVGHSKHYCLLEIELITGRHHQIRAQLSKAVSPIKGDLKYGAPRSNPDGGISLHARSVTFDHPVTKERMTIKAPLPQQSIWETFKELDL
ncbi:MAG: RluA family pseudouridine synthase [Rikenellaceae bacterium]|nr:RluA family pseudouridine synthase [Rikenellaceae bacterium]